MTGQSPHDAPVGPSSDGWVESVLGFWFQEIEPAQWFKKDDDFDRRVRERFLAVHEEVAAAPLARLTRDARTLLAAVIALDQLPRNMFRGSPRAFATDAKALTLAEAAVAAGFDQGLGKAQRQFLYLPFEHCEAAEAQARCVALFSALGDAELVKWAEAHKAIIDRFGRFPHRNAILGRASTPEEDVFLALPGSAF